MSVAQARREPDGREEQRVTIGCHLEITSEFRTYSTRLQKLEPTSTYSWRLSMLDLEVRLTSDVRTYSSLLQMLELLSSPLQMFELKVRYFKC